MKKLRKFIKKLNNRGSSLVMVIVSLAFIGIVVGALLTAAGYAYRLRLQDLNSRDNFYYVEQAMNEIYTGVGSKTIKNLQDAYVYTIENMSYYDLETNTYKNKNPEEISDLFKDKYMANVANNEFFKASESDIGDRLEEMISNESVHIDKTKLKKLIEYDSTNKVTRLTIQNVTLYRTREYERSTASGKYTQSITTDIVIDRPPFDVQFDKTEDSTENIFKYAIVADMGIEVKQPTTPLSITGNVYAAADYYNKVYNYSETVKGQTPDYNIKYKNGDDEDVDIKYTHNAVSSRVYDANSVTVGTGYKYLNETTDAPEYYFDGGVTGASQALPNPDDKFRSMYSGIYIDNSDVNFLSDYIIVPGTVAVMNHGKFAAFGLKGTATSDAQIWADNVVLGGSSIKTTTDKGVKYSGSTADIKGNMYIKDDTEINSAGSTLNLVGSYYGFSDSTTRDDKKVLDMLKPYFEVEEVIGGETKTVNRGHHNSSAIIINGQDATLDFSAAKNIFLAGRAYIERSKYRNDGIESYNTEVAGVQIKNTVTDIDLDANPKEMKNAETVTYEFRYETDDSTEDNKKIIRDYKTGESVSVKSNQLAYIPVAVKSVPEEYEFTLRDGSKLKTMVVKIDPQFAANAMKATWESTHFNPTNCFFAEFFPEAVFGKEEETTITYRIPVVAQKVDGKISYYYDFDTAYELMIDFHANNARPVFAARYPSAQVFASKFIEAYTVFLNKDIDRLTDTEKSIRSYLVDITDFKDFPVSEVIFGKRTDNGSIDGYTSGGITLKDAEEFTVKLKDSSSELNAVIAGTDFKSTSTTDLIALSDDYEKQYNYIKWNLGPFKLEGENVAKETAEKSYIDDLLADSDFGSSAVTPINKFVNIGELNDMLESVTGGEMVITLDSGYKVWTSLGLADKKLKISADGSNGIVRGMIITEGDVIFDDNVRQFEGLIVSGGKVVINKSVTQITASSEICKAIINECILTSKTEFKKILKLFRGYEKFADADASGEGAGVAEEESKKIESIEYSDIVKFDNWMKNVD